MGFTLNKSIENFCPASYESDLEFPFSSPRQLPYEMHTINTTKNLRSKTIKFKINHNLNIYKQFMQANFKDVHNPRCGVNF